MRYAMWQALIHNSMRGPASRGSGLEYGPQGTRMGFVPALKFGQAWQGRKMPSRQPLTALLLLYATLGIQFPSPTGWVCYPQHRRQWPQRPRPCTPGHGLRSRTQLLAAALKEAQAARSLSRSPCTSDSGCRRALAQQAGQRPSLGGGQEHSRGSASAAKRRIVPHHINGVTA